MNSRLKSRSPLLWSVAVICVVITAWVTYGWCLVREGALKNLKEIKGTVNWQGMGGDPTDQWPAGFVRYWPFTRLHSIKLPRQNTDPEIIAQAINAFGGVESISFDQGDATWVFAILERLEHPSRVKKLQVTQVYVDYGMQMILKRLVSLEELTLSPSELTGTSFPVLPSLRKLDLGASLITDEGLRAILYNYNLEQLDISIDRGWVKDVVEAVSVASIKLKSLNLYASYWTKDMANDFRAQMKLKNPRLELTVRTDSD